MCVTCLLLGLDAVDDLGDVAGLVGDDLGHDLGRVDAVLGHGLVAALLDGGHGGRNVVGVDAGVELRISLGLGLALVQERSWGAAVPANITWRLLYVVQHIKPFSIHFS